MKTRDRLRLRKRNVSYFDAMLNDALPRQERITLLSRLYSGMRSGGKADRSTALERSLTAPRIEAMAPLVEEIVAYSEALTDDSVAGDLWRLLTEPFPDDPYVIAVVEREDLWPHGIPSRTRFREFIASLSAAERTTLHLPNRDGPPR